MRGDNNSLSGAISERGTTSMLRSILYSVTATAITSVSMTQRGSFILFEGIDRCGKTTQCQLLTDRLNAGIAVDSAKKAEFIRFPNRSSHIGQLINSYLTNAEQKLEDHTVHLLFSANRWEAREMIEEKLSSGCHLICDRYAYSGVAYTSAKGLDFDWCKGCDRGLPSPDLVVFVDILPEEAAMVMIT